MGEVQISFWIGFHIFVLAMLALDLGVFHKNSHVVSIKEALSWSVVWIALALVFNAWIYSILGRRLSRSSPSAPP